MLTGGCHCGTTRYETNGAPFNETVCYCIDCCRVSGAVGVAWFSVPRTSFRWTGAEPSAYGSSPGHTRHFCGTCSTSVIYEADTDPDELDIATATLDDPALVPPQDHVFVSHCPAWVTIGDDLPQHQRRRTSGSTALAQTQSGRQGAKPPG